MLFVQKPLQKLYDGIPMIAQKTLNWGDFTHRRRPSKKDGGWAFAPVGPTKRLEVIKAYVGRMAISIEYFGSSASHSIHAKSGDCCSSRLRS